MLPLLLATGVVGAVLTAWALPRSGRTALLGAGAGVVALAVVAALAAWGGAGGSLWNGSLAPNTYLRLVVGLWALDAILLAAIAWLLGGLAGLRGLLPAALAGIVGGAVTLASSSPAIGALGAAATGLAALPVLLAAARPSAGGTAAREIRVSVATAAGLLAVVAVVPIAGRFVLSNGDAPGIAAGSGPAATVALAVLILALALVARLGIIPFHVRVAALSDVASPASLPLLLAWLPLPFAAAALVVADGQLAPLGLPLGPERAVVVGLTLATLAAAALAAFIADDLRHATGYLVIADLGLVVLALAALDPAAWGPARAWLVVVAVSKTALGAWTAVAEDRFETRSIPDLRGWLHSAPILGVGLVVIVVATFGLPGWVALEARGSLARLAAGAPWDVLLVLAGFLTLPTYLRLLGLGLGTATSHVDRAMPERIARGRRPMRPGATPAGDGLPVEREGGDGVDGVDDLPKPAAATRRRAAMTPVTVATGARRQRAEILSACVLTLALLGALVAWGAFDIARVAAEPAPVPASTTPGGG